MGSPRCSPARTFPDRHFPHRLQPPAAVVGTGDRTQPVVVVDRHQGHAAGPERVREGARNTVDELGEFDTLGHERLSPR